METMISGEWSLAGPASSIFTNFELSLIRLIKCVKKLRKLCLL